ncbi:MAG: amino acid ABC transporter ATP-binding protein, partial [Vicinamibacterales bacterium]
MNPGLVVRGLELIRGSRAVLGGVEFTVEPGEIVGLMGVSGAGKSSVLRAIAALDPFTAGSIMVNGTVLEPGPVPPESRLQALRRSVGVVFQGQSLFEHLTVLQNVALAPTYVYRWPPERAREVAHNLLISLGVAACAEAYPRQVSGGEAQRVAIARALVSDPKMLLMDEPTSALDPARRGALGETLRGLASQGRGLLIATHDVEFAHAYADRVAILANGIVVEQGPASTVLDRPTNEATRELLRAPVKPGGDEPAPQRRSGLH